MELLLLALLILAQPAANVERASAMKDRFHTVQAALLVVMIVAAATAGA